MFPPYYIWPVYLYFGGMPAYQPRPIVTRPPVYKPTDDEDVIYLAWYYMLNGQGQP